MTFTYFDMLCGEPLWLDGVGHLRSPKLGEIRPAPLGIGESAYQFYLSLLSWDRDTMLEYAKACGIRGWDKITDARFGPYEIITVLRQLRDAFIVALSFFMVEDVSWDEKRRSFIVFIEKSEEDGGGIEVVGRIDRRNFETVRSSVLELNYIGLDKKEVKTTHSSEKSKELWEKVQTYLKEQEKRNAKRDNPKYHLGNIVSKLCACESKYSLFNVYELTIFQLYDQFFQYSLLRNSRLGEMIYSQHGGDSFKVDGWLMPLNNKF